MRWVGGPRLRLRRCVTAAKLRNGAAINASERYGPISSIWNGAVSTGGSCNFLVRKKSFSGSGVVSLSTTITSKYRRRPGDEAKGIKSSKNKEQGFSQSNSLQQQQQHGAPFVLRNAEGEETSMDDYLATVATLSPWVPCPDVVIRRVLSLARVGSDDIHCDLGSGDGRVNFHALDLCGVRKTMGVEVDTTLVQQSWDRLDKRHPRPSNVHFVCADLRNESESLWKSLAEECTVVTMYFVPAGLEELRPLLETHFLGKKCRIVTIGYEMWAWEPAAVDVVLGLPMHLYDMTLGERLIRVVDRVDGFRNDVEEDEDDDDFGAYSQAYMSFQYRLEREKDGDIEEDDDDWDVPYDENGKPIKK